MSKATTHIAIDYNKDGKITPDDRQIIERDPDFIAALNTSLTWKGFDFYMDWYSGCQDDDR